MKTTSQLQKKPPKPNKTAKVGMAEKYKKYHSTAYVYYIPAGIYFQMNPLKNFPGSTLSFRM